MRLRAAVAIGALAILVAACAGNPAGGGVVDGWLVGPPTVCQDRVVCTDNNAEVARAVC